jgi:pimeloyl-ACP methyl ester carboxylesterase
MSYGSALGATYASMLPDTTDRVVVDGNVGEPHLDGTACVEETLPGFTRWAAARDVEPCRRDIHKSRLR